MSARILLIRHGVCAHVGKRLAGRSPGVELSEEGCRQAELLAERLGKEPIRALYSSPLERTIATALPVSRRLDLPVIPCEALIEIDYGEWSGRDYTELSDNALWKSYNTFRSGTRIPGGDFMPDVQARIADELVLLRKRHGGQCVALFSHCDVIRAALVHVLGMSLDHMLRLEISPGSISEIELADWGVKVHSINDTAHLPSVNGI